MESKVYDYVLICRCGQKNTHKTCILIDLTSLLLLQYYIIYFGKNKLMFPTKNSTSNLLHPHLVLCCSQSHSIFFLFSIVLGLNTLCGALAFCMARLGELTGHIIFSHSLGLMSIVLWGALLPASFKLNIF